MFVPTEKEAFGFKDGIGHPAIEGTGVPGTNPTSRLSRQGSLCLGILMKWQIPLRYHSQRFWGATEAMLSFASYISVSPRFGDI